MNHRHFIRALLAWLAILITVTPAGAVPVVERGTWAQTLQARDLDSNGSTDAFYDTALDITWLADAKVLKTLGLGNARNNMPTAELYAWIDTFNAYGRDDWRLPRMLVPAATSCKSLPGACGPAPLENTSELAHLYYATLGNSGPNDLNGWGPEGNTGPFVNLATKNWYEMQSTTLFNGQPWGFGQATDRPGYQNYGTWDHKHTAWPVLDGDAGGAAQLGVLRPVPEPAGWALLLVGLLAIAARRIAS